ncbi:MAG: hypothetical protein KME18_13380 [Phormidium tanganyikae FI6-MK23]|nr:hypothetical protein [Phormidium tanganyikae FI6-MK23]
MIISDLDHLKTVDASKISGGLYAFSFANAFGSAGAFGNIKGVATAVTATVTTSIVVGSRS